MQSIDLLVTPISKQSKKRLCEMGSPDSRRDFLEQQNREVNGLSVMWDDSKYNKSKVGDYFAFVQNYNCAQIHEIIGVLSPDHRLPTWSSNVGQQKRNVLMLSKTKCIIDWADWITIGGPKKVQGTQSVKTNLLHILAYIDSVSI